MSLETATDNEIWKLRDELKKPFRERDRIWRNRRKVRYRRMGPDLEALPLNPRIKDTALMVYQTELPNQEAHRRTKRLIANRPRFEVVLFKTGPEFQDQGQELENGIKALYNWMNRGKPTVEWKVVEHQQGDGLGILKADFLPGHGVSLGAFDPDDLAGDDEAEDIDGAEGRNRARSEFRKALDKHGSEARAFDQVTNDALRSEYPPFRLIAVDPLNCYWWEDDDGVAVILETGEKSLNPLLEAFSDYGLRYDKETGKVFIDQASTEAVGARTYLPPLSTGSDLSQRVEYSEIRTRESIFIMIEHPILTDKAPRDMTADGGKGVVFRFPNPFGSHTTGYALVPGDVTTDDDPAYKYQPVIEGVLSTAQALNVLMTARLSASMEEALAPAYVKVTSDQDVPPSDEEKAPTVEQANRDIPVIPGEIKRIETPNADLDRAEVRLIEETNLYRMAEAQLGDATSDTSGHRLAIQVSQADIQMVPYQNARKGAMEEIMKGIIYAVRKHGLPVYIPTMPEGTRRGSKVRVSDAAVIKPDMADLPFDLIVTLGAETPVTKFAKWQALAQRMEQGTAGYQTVVEQSDTEDPDEEIARVFEGRMLISTMEELVPVLVQLAVAYGKQRVMDQITGGGDIQPPDGQQLAFGIDPATGMMGGGGGGVDARDMTRVPGVNQALAPSTTDFGPSVMEPIEAGSTRGF